MTPSPKLAHAFTLHYDGSFSQACIAYRDALHSDPSREEEAVILQQLDNLMAFDPDRDPPHDSSGRALPRRSREQYELAEGEIPSAGPRSARRDDMQGEEGR